MSEKNYSEWSVRSLWGEIHNLSAFVERETTDPLRRRNKEKADLLFEKYQEQVALVIRELRSRLLQERN